nr:HPP family protein [Rhodoferax saidenbachensis]
MIDARERWRSVLGALVGMGLTAWLSHWLLAANPGSIWMLAPMGASAVLVFAVPASPLAQPWAVLGGNGVSALVGVLCARWIDQPVLAASLAVPLAILVMLWLRCLHPPGGAMALSAVLSHWVGLDIAWGPLAVNGGLMIAAGVAYNSLTGRPYPHVQRRVAGPVSDLQGRFTPGDLDAALAHYNQILDVSRDDLENLLQHAEMAAYRRNLGTLTCADVMSKSPIAVQFGTPLHEAWALLNQHGIKALPVVDRVRRMVGIVTVADFMRHAGLEQGDDLGQRFQAFIRRSGKVSSDKPEAVGQIMTRQVRVASAHRPLMELVPLFSEGGHHHIPIIDTESRLVGIITQSDLVRALYRAVRVDG